ncbi:protein takeout-like [Ctenocephalides felis]|uniref:protein takeout-like n=1 Tax=Ctenocephalides felis TaxID=7515 RepID=UPI000E6E4F14|nr:protein takeout-like [Ctenocephalides felis]
MAITNIVVILTFVTFFSIIQAEELPPYLKVCTRKEGDIAQCVKRAIEGLRPIFLEGDKARNIPSLEPLEVGDLLVGDYGRSNGGLRISATEIMARGASNFHIEKISGDLDKLEFYFEVLLPRLETTGKYAVDGNVLLLPIKGSGPFTGNFTDSVGKAVMQGEIVEKDGQKHIKFTDLNIKIKVGKGRLHLKNLFGGDKALGDIINHTINTNFEVLSKDIIPLIEKALSKLILKISNQIVEPYTTEQLYPDE